MAKDQITLIVPAKSEYARAVRMTAAALASRIGMTYEEVEDVRMAADEAFVYASDTLSADAEIRFLFILGEEDIEIDVGLGVEQPNSDEDSDRNVAYATFILESVCDTYEFASDENGAHLRLFKRAGGIDAGQA
jgi:serine/threonine-protein kinase RsbW